MPSEGPNCAGQTTNTRRNAAPGEASENRRGMVLPFAPLAVAFNNIRYSVDMPPVTSLDYFTIPPVLEPNQKFQSEQLQKTFCFIVLFHMYFVSDRMLFTGRC